MTAPTRRSRNLARLVALLLGAAVLAPAWATAHSPDPAIGWPLFAQDQALSFRWRAGEIPPDKMKAPIIAGAADATATRGGSRAPTFAYAAGGASTVEYGLNVFCGINGLACADGSDAPDSFRSRVPRARPPVRLGRPELVPDAAGIRSTAASTSRTSCSTSSGT